MDLCVKLALALEVPLADMVRAHAQDSVYGAAPERLKEVEGQLGGGKSHWEEIADHHGLRIEHGTLFGTVSVDGDLKITRHYAGCFATRPRQRIAFRDRIIGERAPAFAVKGSPKGLGYNMNVAIEGEWVEHRVDFQRPWTEADGAFEFEFETLLPKAFVLDLEEYNRRRAAEGLTRVREHRGDFCTMVTYPFEVLELVVAFPKSYAPQWREPTAVWGGGPIDDADYTEVHKRTCLSATFTPAGNSARLLLRRPAPGYMFGIQWTPVAWDAESEGEAQ
jgi:hypothetical protein